LIEGSDYFRVPCETITRGAARMVFILLGISTAARNSRPTLPTMVTPTLGDLPHDVAATRQWLRIYILAWAFALLYTVGREWSPV